MTACNGSTYNPVPTNTVVVPSLVCFSDTEDSFIKVLSVLPVCFAACITQLDYFDPEVIHRRLSCRLVILTNK